MIDPRRAVRALPRRGLGALRRSRRTRRSLAAAVVLVLLAGAGWAWLRDSSLVAVRTVTFVGFGDPRMDAARAALRDAALGMTTLDVRVDELRRVAARFPIVEAVHATARFPHGLRIEVVEHRPVAVLPVDAGRVAVAADGTVLPPSRATRALPVVRIPGRVGARLRGPALGAVRLVAVAPAPLRRRLTSVAREPTGGLEARLRRGPRLRFGEARDLVAKWTAAARVLADPAVAGAAYVDVRVPRRPAVGGP